MLGGSWSTATHLPVATPRGTFGVQLLLDLAYAPSDLTLVLIAPSGATLEAATEYQVDLLQASTTTHTFSGITQAPALSSLLLRPKSTTLPYNMSAPASLQQIEVTQLRILPFLLSEFADLTLTPNTSTACPKAFLQLHTCPSGYGIPLSDPTSSACAICSPSTASPGGTGASPKPPCSPCQAGYYSPSAGRAACLQCPTGLYSLPGEIACYVCSEQRPAGVLPTFTTIPNTWLPDDPVVHLPTGPDQAYSFRLAPFLLLDTSNAANTAVMLQLVLVSKATGSAPPEPLLSDLPSGGTVTVTLQATPIAAGSPTTTLTFAAAAPSSPSATFMTLPLDPTSPPFPFSLTAPPATLILAATQLQRSSQTIPAARGCNQLRLLSNTCPPGYGTTSSGGPTACLKCAAGSISPGASPGIAKVPCTPCQPGTYSVAGQESCAPCPEGQWSLEGQASCWSCPASTHSLKVAGPLSTSSASTQMAAAAGVTIDILLYLGFPAQGSYTASLKPSTMLPGNTQPLAATLSLISPETNTTYTYTTTLPPTTSSDSPRFRDMLPARPVPYSPSSPTALTSLQVVSLTTTTTTTSPPQTTVYTPSNSCHRMRLLTNTCPPGYGTSAPSASASGCTLCPVLSFSPGGTPADPQPPCQPCPPATYTITPGSTQCTHCFWAASLGQDTPAVEARCGRCPPAAPLVPLSAPQGTPQQRLLRARSQNFTLDIIMDPSSSSFQAALLPLAPVAFPSPCTIALNLLVGPLQTPLQLSASSPTCLGVSISPSQPWINSSTPAILLPPAPPNPLPYSLSAPLDTTATSGAQFTDVRVAAVSLQETPLSTPQHLLLTNGCDRFTMLTNACPRGYGVSAPGQATCTLCPAGTFSPGGTVAAPKPLCSGCPAGSYSSSSGVATCAPCAAGTTSDAGDAACAVCPPVANVYPVWSLPAPGGASPPPTLQATSNSTTWSLHITQDHSLGLLRIAAAPADPAQLAQGDSVLISLELPSSNVIRFAGRATAADANASLLQLLPDQPWRLSLPSPSTTPSTALLKVRSIWLAQAAGGPATRLVPNRGCSQVRLVTNACAAGWGAVTDAQGVVRCEKCTWGYFSPGGSGSAPHPTCQQCPQNTDSAAGAASCVACGAGAAVAEDGVCAACPPAAVKLPYSGGQTVQEEPQVKLRAQQGVFGASFVFGAAATGDVHMQALLWLPQVVGAAVQAGNQVELQTRLASAHLATFSAAVPANWTAGAALVLAASDQLQPASGGGATTLFKDFLDTSPPQPVLVELLTVTTTHASTPTSYPHASGCNQAQLLLGACPAGWGLVGGSTTCQRCGAGLLSLGGTAATPRPSCQACATVATANQSPLSDAANCGGCGVACSSMGQALGSPAGVQDICLDGACSVTVPPGGQLVRCQGVVVNSTTAFLTDTQHCGGCGVRCMGSTQLPAGVADDVCSGGSCGLAYRAGWQVCGGRVVSTATAFLEDVGNCGACGNVCSLAASKPAGAAVDVCVQGVCDVAPAAGWEVCGGVLKQVPGGYVADVSNCRTCGRQCVVPAGLPVGSAAAAVCAGGTCNVSAAAGWEFCGGQLVSMAAAYADDPWNCGSCGTVCSGSLTLPAGTARDVCIAGQCQVQLGADWEYCNGTLVQMSVVYASNTSQCGTCGNRCSLAAELPAGAAVDVCQQGVCRVKPAAGWEVCGGVYKQVASAYLSDPSNCGSCGKVCTVASGAPVGAAAQAACVNGVCNLTAAAGWEFCGGVLVQGASAYQSDPYNCGSCGNVCSFAAAYTNQSAARDVCSSGLCLVELGAGSLYTCSGTIMKAPDAFQANTSQCGGCAPCNLKGLLPGDTFAGVDVCAANACNVTAAPLHTFCAGRYTAPLRDPKNCGACGSQCSMASTCAAATAEVCYAGNCGMECGRGLIAPWNETTQQMMLPQCEPTGCYLLIQGNSLSVSTFGSQVEWAEVRLWYTDSDGVVRTLQHPIVQVERSSVGVGFVRHCVDGYTSTACGTALQTSSVANITVKFPCRYNVTSITLVSTGTTANTPLVNTPTSAVVSNVAASNLLTLYGTGGLPTQTMNLRSFYNNWTAGSSWTWDIYACSVQLTHNATLCSGSCPSVSITEVALFTNGTATRIPASEISISASSVANHTVYPLSRIQDGSTSTTSSTMTAGGELGLGLTGASFMRITYPCRYRLDVVQVNNRPDYVIGTDRIKTMVATSNTGPFSPQPVPAYSFNTVEVQSSPQPYIWEVSGCAVVINFTASVASAESILNLAEVSLYASGSATKIPASEVRLTLSSTLDSATTPASACYDGSLSTYCSTRNSTWQATMGQTAAPALTINYPCSYQLGTVKVYNRQDASTARILQFTMWSLRPSDTPGGTPSFAFNTTELRVGQPYSWDPYSCAVLFNFTWTTPGADGVLDLAEVELYANGSATKIPAAEISISSSSVDAAFPLANCLDGNTQINSGAGGTFCATQPKAVEVAGGLVGVPFMRFQFPCRYELDRVAVYTRADNATYWNRTRGFTMWYLRSPPELRRASWFAFNTRHTVAGTVWDTTYTWDINSCGVLINYTTPIAGSDPALYLNEVELYASGSATKIPLSELKFVASSAMNASTLPAAAYDGDTSSGFVSGTVSAEQGWGLVGVPMLWLQHPCSYTIDKVVVWNTADPLLSPHIRSFTVWTLRPPSDTRTPPSLALNTMEPRTTAPYIWEINACSVLINQTSIASNSSYTLLQLLDVELFANGSATKIPAAALKLTLSSTFNSSYPASNCYDDNLTTWCMSKSITDQKAAGLQAPPWLSIEYPCSYQLDLVKLYNPAPDSSRINAFTVWSLKGFYTPLPAPSFYPVHHRTRSETSAYTFDITACAVLINFTSPAYQTAANDNALNLAEVELFGNGSTTKIPSAQLTPYINYIVYVPAIKPWNCIDGNYSNYCQGYATQSLPAAAIAAGGASLTIQYPCSYQLDTVKLYNRVDDMQWHTQPYTVWNVRGSPSPPSPSYPFHTRAFRNTSDPYIFDIYRCSLVLTYNGSLADRSKFLAMTAVALYNGAGTLVVPSRMELSSTAAVGKEAANCNAEPAAPAAEPACQSWTVGRELDGRQLGRPFLEAVHPCSEVVRTAKVWVATSYPTAMQDFEMRLWRGGFPTATAILLGNMASINGVYTWVVPAA